ncbi:MAG: hypothetical protein SGARI_004130, partial [Bacillariaceae sp.]
MHHEGIDKFIESVEPLFGDVLQAIQIVFVSGTAVVTSASDSMQDDSMPNPSPVNENDGTNESMEMLFEERSKRISLLITQLQQRIDAKAEELFLQNRSQIQFDSKGVSRMDITLSSIDSKVGFHRLLQTWTRESLAARTQSSNQTLRLKLPETAEFDACVVTLQASYKILPFRLDSSITTFLLVELEKLSRASLEIVQLTPIDSIDASLLFGVAIELKAGMTDSTNEHAQNLMLLQSMYKTLASKDCALLIRATHPRESGASFAQDAQYFVLLPELIGSTAGKPTANGVLHRISCGDYLMGQDTLNDTHRVMQTDEQMENPFEECVEASLEALDCSSFNPLSFRSFHTNVDKATEPSVAEASGTVERKKVTWGDECVC